MENRDKEDNNVIGLFEMEASLKDTISIMTSEEVDPYLLKMLDRGVDDVIFGRVIMHNDTMKEIEKIRSQRKESPQS